jgi:hypothetical protein
MEYLIDPVRIIAHGGDTVYFHSDMILIPEAHFGYFLSYNSLGKARWGGRGEVWRTLVNRYFPDAGQPKVDADPNSAKSTDMQSVVFMMERDVRDNASENCRRWASQFNVRSDKEGCPPN